jgi:hypothetical protein
MAWVSALPGTHHEERTCPGESVLLKETWYQWSTTPSTFNTTSRPAARFGALGPRRCKPGRLQLRRRERELTTALLRPRPVPVTVPADALRLIAADPPDVVVLDLGLPDLDGKDVIARVRAWSDVQLWCSRPESVRGRRLLRWTSAQTISSTSLLRWRTHGPPSSGPAPPDAALRRDADRAGRRA